MGEFDGNSGVKAKLLACAHEDRSPWISGTVGTAHVSSGIVANHVDPAANFQLALGESFNEMYTVYYWKAVFTLDANSETCGMTTINHVNHSMATVRQRKRAGPLKVIMLGQLRQKLPCLLELHSIGFAALLEGPVQAGFLRNGDALREYQVWSFFGGIPLDFMVV